MRGHRAGRRSPLGPGRSTLGELRALVAERLGCGVPPFRSPVRPATIAIVAAGGLAVYLLLPEFSSIAEVRSVIAHAHKGWLAVTVASGMLAVVASSWTILGAARDRLPVGRTVRAGRGGVHRSHDGRRAR